MKTEDVNRLIEQRKALAQPVDAVNMTPDRVDETAKGEHKPVDNSAHEAEEHAWFPVPKREWVGLTRRELDIATLGLEDLGDCYLAIEAKLKEKNT